MAMSDGWGANKGKTFPIEILEAAEVSALLQATSKRAPSGIRDRALVAVLFFAGLRLQEALDLMPRDVDLKRGTLNVRRGKGGKQRIVAFVGEAGLAYLERWMDRRKLLGLTGRQRLFCTLQGRPLAGTNVRAKLKRLAARAGIEKRVHPHGLRHSHAAHLAMSGKAPVHLIQEQLGHGSLAITERYIRHLTPEERIERLRSIDLS